MKRKLFKLFLFQICLLVSPLFAHGSLYISEIAWMGNASNANAEWIEIYNDSSEDLDLSGFSISGSINISFLEGDSVVGKGYFLLERTSDNTIPEINADKIYTGALSNTGGSLILKNKEGEIIDNLNFSSGWPAGDNTTKETMQRVGSAWHTSTGTPKAPAKDTSTDNVILTNDNSTPITTNENNKKSNAPYREMSAKILLPQNVIPSNVSNNFSVILYDNYGEKLERGTVIWNFGDGNIKEVSSFEVVNHKYKYPGEYVISIQYFKNSKSEEPDIESLASIKVVKGELVISSIGTMDNQYIEIENKSAYDISLKGWHLVANGKIFVFPGGTYIKAGRKNIFDLEALGFNINEINPVYLFRPNFELEHVYPENFSIPNNTIKNFNQNTTKNNDTVENIVEDENNIFDLSTLEENNLISNSSNSLKEVPLYLVLIIFIVFCMLAVFYIRRIKENRSNGDVDNVNASDIDIIE